MSKDSTPSTDFPLDELTAHVAWLRRLALRLVRDAAAADDLVQEAWLAALERPPSTDRPLRPWLGGVLRNLVKRRARTEHRRTAREQVVAARREPLATPEQLAERLELQRRLARAVAELEEPFRSTLQLRYDEGLSAAEIARRQGIPDGTVRSRCKTALDRLRERLDQDHGGDRRAWVLMWIPLVVRDAQTLPDADSGAGSTATAATRIGGLAALIPGALGMTSATKITIAVGVVLTAVLGLTLAGRAYLDAAPRQVEQVSFEPQRERVQRPRAGAVENAPGGEAADVGTTAASAPGSIHTVLRGRVVEPSGGSLAGAELVVHSVSGTPTATTDSRGAYELEFALPDADWTVTVHASARARASVSTDVRAKRGRTMDLADLVLAPGGAIRGVVRSEAGVPLPGARVDLGEAGWAGLGYDSARRWRSNNRSAGPGVRTNASGVFELEGIAVGTHRIWASLDGYLSTVSGPIEVRAGMVSTGARVDLPALRDEDVVAGQVLNPDGTPSARADVKFRYDDGLFGSGSGNVTADADGRFQRVVTADSKYDFSAIDRAERFGTAAAADVPAGTTDLVLHLTEPRYLRLLVTDGSEHVERFDVRVLDVHGATVHEYLPVANRDAAGARIKVPAEPFIVRVRGEVHREATLGPLEPGTLPDVLRVSIAEVPGIRGTVTVGGEPVAGAVVTLHAATSAEQRVVHNGFETRWNPQAVATMRSDDAGHFRLTPRASGMHLVRVEARGLAPGVAGPLSVDPASGQSGVLVALTTGAVLTGRAQVGQVVGISQGLGHPRCVRCDREGAYRFEHLAPGGYQVRVIEVEFGPGNSQTLMHKLPSGKRGALAFDGVLTEGATQEHDLSGSGSAAALVGRLTLGSADPLGWTVRVLPASWVDQVSTGGQVAVAGDGSFRIRLDRAGAARLLALDPRGRVSLFRPIRAERGENRVDLGVDLAPVHVLAAPGPEQLRTAADSLPALIWRGDDGAMALTTLIGSVAGDGGVDRAPVGSNDLVLVPRTAVDLDPADLPALATIEIAADGSTEIDLGELLGDVRGWTR